MHPAAQHHRGVRFRSAQGLDRLCDRLFGDGEGFHPSSGGVGHFLALSALLAAIVVARRSDLVTLPQFFGEDGFVYFHDGVVFGARAILRSYAGFPHLGQRLIGFLGSLVPFSDAPRVYTTVSMAIIALGVASFSLPGFEHVVRRKGLRSLWCVAAVSLPLEEGVVPRTFEGLLASPSNLGWWLAVWLSLLSLVRLPRSPLRVALLALTGALAVWSTPLAAVNLPLWLLRIWMGVRQSRPRDTAFALTLVVALALLIAGYGALGAQSAGSLPSAFADPLAYVRFVLGLTAYRTTTLALPPVVSAWVGGIGVAGMDLVAVLIFSGLIAGCAAGRWRGLPLLAAILWLDLGSWCVSAAGRQLWGHFPVAEFPARYAVLPGSMLVLGAVVVIDFLPSKTSRILATSALAGLLTWSWAPRFLLPPLVDQEWPHWAGLLEEKLATGSRDQLAIPTNPTYKAIVFDGLEYPPQLAVPPDTIIAGLGTRGSLSQEFVARCDGLSLVEIRLGKQRASTQGALRWFIIDVASGKILVEQEIPRTELPADKSWQPFRFDPIAGSNGRTFEIVLRAVDNTVGSMLYVLGARGDPYPEGRVFQGATLVDGDASFRYACARP